uniref:putative low molecular weight protein-tyrosine-phosphatase slr0328 n=1 Tax=Erigeron canadensis TaxID=72917 RepID=UPI001CB8ED17|nr:putative low molecular weight protein-tyrosine-phosphatase slr0328 [Erigeron canadensis]
MMSLCTNSILPIIPNLPVTHFNTKTPILTPFSPQNPHSFNQSLNLFNQRLKIKQTPLTIITSSMASTAQSEEKPFSVLFVCLGNICRSPAAEGVFTNLVQKRNLSSKFVIDSAGTINYHEGGPADSRMRAASKRRGIEITSISRPIRPSDFKEFDLILAMDRQNKEDILAALERWSFTETLPADAHKKVQLMCSYCKKHDETEVPDPYYGGAQGFEKVLDLLEDACESLLESIVDKSSS